MQQWTFREASFHLPREGYKGSHRGRGGYQAALAGTVAAFSGFQLLRNMWKLHAVSQLNKPGGKMAESEKLGH